MATEETGYYRIKKAHSELFIDCTAANVNATLHLMRLSNRAYQRWQLIALPNPLTYVLRNEAGVFLKVDGTDVVGTDAPNEATAWVFEVITTDCTPINPVMKWTIQTGSNEYVSESGNLLVVGGTATEFEVTIDSLKEEPIV